LPWASFSLLFLYLVGRQLVQALTHWASENENLLALQENLLVPDDQTALFSSPANDMKTYCVVPENSSLWKFQLWFILSFTSVGF